MVNTTPITHGKSRKLITVNKKQSLEARTQKYIEDYRAELRCDEIEVLDDAITKCEDKKCGDVVKWPLCSQLAVIKGGAALKALFLTVKFSPSSMLQVKAFSLFRGKELEHYLRLVKKLWVEEMVNVATTGYFSGTRLPEGMRELVDNENITVKHVKFIFEHKKVSTNAKASLIKFCADKKQEGQKIIFDEETIDYFLKLNKRFKVDITPIFPSLRIAHNLEGVPDEWLTEMYMMEES